MLRDLAFTALLTVANAQSLFPSDISVSTGDGEVKRPASIIATVERSFVPAPSSSSAQDVDNNDIYYTPNTTKKMCPVVSMGLEPDASPMKIKPSYRTFVPEDPLHIEVYSDKGVTFAEFFIQAKDPATNATVGHWRIDDVQQEAYKCSSEGSQALLDTVHWQSNGLSQQRKVVLDWAPSFHRDKTPDSVHFIGTFKTLTGIYEHTLSQSVLLRKDLSITECCEQEVTAECLPMCKSTNLVDSLTMSTESCKHQMHKLQRCYLTGKDHDDFNPEEAGVAERTNFLRVDCCSKESLDAECNTLCEDGGVNAWGVLMGTCQHALRQVTACWTSTSCVNRCDSTWRGDYACQCDSDCTRRGDCCPDRDMSCRASLPVKLEYWPGQKGDCGKVPDFDAFTDMPGEKKTSQMRFDTKDAEEGNLFGIQTAKTFAARLTSYFFVREKGTYKVFMLLGQRDTGT